jgi:uncharacterized membrane protein
MSGDLVIIIRWWAALWFLGIMGWPITAWMFNKWGEMAYWLAKIVGILALVYIVWILGSLKLLPYSWMSIGIATAVLIWTDYRIIQKTQVLRGMKIGKIAALELIFLGLLLFWSWIKAHEPTINGLEKFMDFGFTKSILQGSYFPPRDMWFAGESINYYYFGHLIMATISKMSGVDLAYGFNLMLATLFALTFSMSWTIGSRLLKNLKPGSKLMGGLFIALLVTMAGNLHTIYAFTKGYWGKEDNPPPFWTIWEDVRDKEQLKQGWDGYWYPNATRFIPYTIHEFPSYSFVVSDVHGHVLAIPLDLLLIALLILIFAGPEKEKRAWIYAVYGVVAGTAFMTNALDGPIYIGLFAMLLITQNLKFLIFNLKSIFNYSNLKPILNPLFITGGAFILTAMPFLMSFKPFVNGIAVNCPPAFLANRKLGPLIFEGTDKCQKSPIWMMLVLWGFFLYCGLGLTLKTGKHIPQRDLLIIMSTFCFILIIFPEFFYFKDIYPMHFRSNTMFKLGYQVFMMMSFVSGTVIVNLLLNNQKWKEKIFLLGTIPLLFLILIYPYFSVKSYFNGLKDYKGLYGLEWMADKYPDDLAAVNWFGKNIPPGQQPVILEAAGDSYTDFERISAFTGLPTVAGWMVHEWLWRGDYAPIAQRDTEVQTVYESANSDGKQIIDKYKIEYIVVGDMERNKYPQMDEGAIKAVASPVFVQDGTTIYKVN